MYAFARYARSLLSPTLNKVSQTGKILQNLVSHSIRERQKNFHCFRQHGAFILSKRQNASGLLSAATSYNAIRIKI